MKKFVFGILIGMILTGVSFAADQPKHNATYNNHSLCFEVPQNWSVYKEINDTKSIKVVVSDGTSAIGIDLIKNQDVRKIVGEYLEYHLSKSELERMDLNLDNLSARDLRLAYENYQWGINGAIYDYYIHNIIRSQTGLGQSGSGISVWPDNVENAAIGTNFGHEKNPIEWILAWTKPEYDDEFIAVHALFTGNYTQKDIEWRGSPYDNSMPEPLWVVLTTLNRGDKPLSKHEIGSSLADLV